MKNKIIPIYVYILYSIFIIPLVSCEKDIHKDTIQFSVLGKDTLNIKYYNGKDTINHVAKHHFSTSFTIYDDKLPYISVKGIVYKFDVYLNGTNITYLYKESVYNRVALINKHRLWGSRFNRYVIN